MIEITSNKYIYALDLAMGCSGIVIYDNDEGVIVHISSAKSKAKDTHGERLRSQREYVKRLIKEYPPLEVIIEKGFTQYNKATQVIFRVHGVYNELLADYKQTYYTPTEVKKCITGKGNASKDIVRTCVDRDYIQLLNGCSMDNEDESDAVAVLITHLMATM